MKLFKYIITTFLLLAISISTPLSAFSQQKTEFKILNKFRIESPGGWDYITVDPNEKRIYASHGNQINILNETTGDSIGVIKNTPGTHGVAIVNSFGKGYISNGPGSCTVFDLKSNAVLKQIAVGVFPDYILYDPYTKRLFVFNGKSYDVSVIDPSTDNVVGTVKLGERPETGVSDGNGKIYVNGVNNSEIIEFSAVSLKVTKRFQIKGGKGPTGLDMDRKNKILFIGCSDNNTMIVMNSVNGKILCKFPIGDCDALVFDPVLKFAYASNKEGSITVVKELSPSNFLLVENIQTLVGARTVAIDPLTHHLFLPTAVSPWVDDPKTRPAALSGTFCVLEVGR